MDERTNAAALRRAEREVAKRLKLAKAAEKIERARNSVEMKNQQTAASLSEKMRLAEEQAQRHLDSIVKKAESENVKVDEISFINALNEQDFEEQLNQKLQETNDRINAARERRRLAQAKMSSKNERRRVQSAKVMSERELEREKQQQQRWEKLQVRIKAVNERRQNRLVEAMKIAEIKKEKMDAALVKRQAMEEAVVQRSAEKEQRRFLADVRRSGDLVECSEGSSSPAKEDRDAAAAVGFDEGVATRTSPKVVVSKMRSSSSAVRDSFEEILNETPLRDGETTMGGGGHSAALKLLAQLDTCVDKLSRDEKKKRRKKIAHAKKKLREEVEWAGKGLGQVLTGRYLSPDAGYLPSNVEAAILRLNEEIESLPPPVAEYDGRDGLAPTKGTMLEFPRLDSEVDKLASTAEKAFRECVVEAELGGGAAAVFILKEVLRCLVKCGKVMLGMNHRLHWSKTSQSIAGSIRKVVDLTVSKGDSTMCAGMLALLGIPDGPTFVLEAATRTTCFEAHGLLMEKDEGDASDARAGAKRYMDTCALDLLRRMLTCYDGDVKGEAADIAEQIATRKLDLLRYLVLTPLCEGICSLLRAAGNKSKNNFVASGAIPVVEALALFFRGTTKFQDDDRLIETMDSLCTVEADSVPVKDVLLEKVGGGLISLVASLLDTKDPNSVGVNEEGLGLSTLALGALIKIARLDLRRFQVLCKGEVSSGWTGGGGYLEFQYCIGKILGGVETKGIDECLAHCIVLIGYYVVGNVNNQQRLHWGGEGQTLLNKLSSLPFAFFCDPAKKKVLFPTLVAACLECETNRLAIEADLNPELLSVFLREKLEALESGPQGATWEDVVSCTQRVPVELWQGAIKFFEEKRE